MKAAAIFGIGLAASLAIHAGLAAVAPRLLAPDPIQAQSPPKTSLRIETEQVARSDAAPVSPDATQASASPAGGTPLAQGAIPHNRARARPPATETAAALPPPGETLASAMPPTGRVAATPPALQTTIHPVAVPTKVQISTPLAPVKVPEITAPVAALVASTRPKAQAISPAIATTLPVPASPAPMTVAPAQSATATFGLPASAPKSEPVSQVSASVPALPDQSAKAAEALPASAATGATAPQAVPVTQSLAAATPQPDRFIAALAYSGGVQTQLDPQALAAIQSFMQPGDTSAQTTQARDALQALLASVPCARLQAEFSPETGSIVLTGHVPEAGMRTPVLMALQSQVGPGIPVTDATLILPRPQCGALGGIANVGLPQSTDQFTNRKLLGPQTQARSYSYAKGAQLVLDLAAPDYDAYLYVDFFDADGQVIHLAPNDRVPLRQRQAKSTVQVGAVAQGEPFLDITIGPPYGQEIAAAFAASAPLYAGIRPMSEPAEPYLNWLGEQVALARASDPGFKGEWVYFFVATHE